MLRVFYFPVFINYIFIIKSVNTTKVIATPNPIIVRRVHVSPNGSCKIWMHIIWCEAEMFWNEYIVLERISDYLSIS